MKHFVICGPELTRQQFAIGREYIWKLFTADVTSADDALTLSFPEAEYGAQQVRNIIDTAMESGTQIFLTTRYEQGVQHLAGMEVEKLHGLKQGDMNIFLFRNKECTEPTLHCLNDDGMLTNNWPFGVLW